MKVIYLKTAGDGLESAWLIDGADQVLLGEGKSLLVTEVLGNLIKHLNLDMLVDLKTEGECYRTD